MGMKREFRQDANCRGSWEREPACIGGPGSGVVVGIVSPGLIVSDDLFVEEFSNRAQQS